MFGRDPRAAQLAILIVLAIFLHPSTDLHAGTMPIQLAYAPILALIGILTTFVLSRMIAVWSARVHTFGVRPVVVADDVLTLTCTRLC